MLGDGSRRFERTLIGGIDHQLRRRHLRTVEGAGFIQLSILVDVAQLTESLARLRRNPLLQLGVAALELDEMESPHSGYHALLERRERQGYADDATGAG